MERREHEVPVERRGLCEMGFGRRETPSRIGGDAHLTGTPVFLATLIFFSFPTNFSTPPITPVVTELASRHAEAKVHEVRSS